MGEVADVAGLAVGDFPGEGGGGGHRGPSRRGITAFQQRVCTGGVGEGEMRIRFYRAIECLDRPGIHRELRRTALHIGIAGNGRAGGMLQIITVRKHDWTLPQDG